MVKIDRSRALELQFDAETCANDIDTSLSSSEQVFSNFWTDQANGITYFFVVQTPEACGELARRAERSPVSTQIASNGPISVPALSTSYGPIPVPGLLSNVATFAPRDILTNLNQSNIQPVYDIYATRKAAISAAFGATSTRSSPELKKELKPGNTIQVLGQIQRAQFLPGSGHRSDVRGRVRLSAHGRELPERLRGDPGAPRSAASSRCCSSPAPRSAFRRSWARSWRWASPRRTRSSPGHLRARAATQRQERVPGREQPPYKGPSGVMTAAAMVVSRSRWRSAPPARSRTRRWRAR